ncbi:MAG: M48 family metallopeptidase [Proteobacteria bacterium]|nr:M48 family metallopeptidase [Pseudomonadota bacterium]
MKGFIVSYFSQMQTFTVVFLAALALTTGLRLWLARRHIRHIARCRGEVPADFSAHIDLAAHQKAADYSIAKTRLGMVDLLIGAAILIALTLGGALQILHEAWLTLFDAGSHAQGIALIFSVALISGIVDLPLALYRTFVIEAQFGFNKMTLRLFFVDLAKQTLLGVALGLPLLACVLWLMQRMGDQWWLYVWATWIAFNLLVLTLYPTLIAPLFNKFTPLADAGLKARIEALLVKCGFKAQGLFVMDSSKRSSHGNAYFTGFGAAKRIVLFDTLIARLAPMEIEAVLAHELGHFRHHHVWKRMAALFAMSLGFLWLLGHAMKQDWFYAGLNVQAHTTALALMLFFMVVPVFTFLLHPLTSLYSRSHEYEADAYAARHAAPADLVRALVTPSAGAAAHCAPASCSCASCLTMSIEPEHGRPLTSIETLCAV